MDLKNIDIVEFKVNNALNLFYNKDAILIKDGLCERCLAHRFAVHLEEQNFDGYFIDCEYNKRHLNRKITSKRVSNPNGNYIDIVITKRNGNSEDDIICFELKRHNNYRGRQKDRDNLSILTNGHDFGYKFGFYIIFNPNKWKTTIELYSESAKVFDYRLERAENNRIKIVRNSP